MSDNLVAHTDDHSGNGRRHKTVPSDALTRFAIQEEDPVGTWARDPVGTWTRDPVGTWTRKPFVCRESILFSYKSNPPSRDMCQPCSNHIHAASRYTTLF